MPITFACDHCHGTLSIAKRKAYSLIDCPKCGCKQVVPSESKSLKQPASLKTNRNGSANSATATKEVLKTTSPAALKDLPLFERPDFENLLQPGTKKLINTVEAKPAVIVDAEIVNKSPEVKVTIPMASTANVELLDHRDKIILRRRHLILASGLVIILISLSFSVGYLLGRMLK